MDRSGYYVNTEVKKFPPSYLIIRFGNSVKVKTIRWFINRVTGRRIEGGAELLIRRQEIKPKQGLVIHVSASPIKFLQMAEEYELCKTDITGLQREFVASQLDEFLTEGMHIEEFLTTAEKQTLIRHELDNMRALSDDECIMGYENILLFEGKSVMQSMIDSSLIIQIYPLHDYEMLKKLSGKWVMSFTSQPIEDVRTYFGESIALYFTFLGFYTTALLVPATLGFIQMFLTTDTLPYYCVFNVFWVIIFLEVWKRKSNDLAYNWGTIGMTSLDEPQANFRGKLGVDPITGKLQPQYPRWKTNIKMYCVSFPVVIICLFFGFIIMLWSFWAENMVKEVLEPDSWLIMIPSVVYTAVVYVLNLFYRRFATFLTDWENHRTQSQYDRHRVIKLVLFEFVNNFLALFYIAFVIQDLEMLKQQLLTMLIILQAINHLQEAILPLLLQSLTCKINVWKEKEKQTKRSYGKVLDREREEEDGLEEIPALEEEDPRVAQAEAEGMLDEYPGTYDDYLELFIQFGYVILFSSVYPLAALFAVLNNVLEIRADAFKLCKTCQRPMAHRVKNIGAWQRAFEIIGAMSIMTNCGLVWVGGGAHGAGWLRDQSAAGLVVLEHALLGARYLLHRAIPDTPYRVRLALARKNYIAKEALKKERAKKTSKVWRHSSVYGTREAP